MSRRRERSQTEGKINVVKIKENYAQLKEEVQEVRVILIRNIIIAVTSVVFLIILLPIIADTILIELWTYTYDNITVDSSNIELGGEAGGVSLSEIIVKAILLAIINVLYGELRWMYAFTYRIVKFVYLSIIVILVIYLIIFFIFSLIMMNKIKFRVVFLSTLISSFISFILMFILIPNDVTLMNYIVESISDLASSNDIIRELPSFATGIILSFYMGFVTIVFVHFIVTTTLEAIFRKA